MYFCYLYVMKKLARFVLLSLAFLLSGAALAQKGQWVQTAPSGCHAFTWRDGRIEIEWDGDCKNGLVHGGGTVKLYLDKKLSFSGVANFAEGKISGQASINFTSGEKYVGEWKDSKLHGQGTYTYANGNKYVGEFKYGKSDGRGIYYYLASGTEWTGDKYVGEWKDGSRNGQGTYSTEVGVIGLGEWADGKPNGRFIEYRADKSVERSGIYNAGKLVTSQYIDPSIFMRISIQVNGVQPDANGDYTAVGRLPPNDGSPDHQVCSQYGFTVGTVPYAECRQKIDLARQQSLQNEKYYALEQQRYQAQLTEYERVKRQRESDAWIRLGSSLLGNQSPHFGVALGNGLADMQGLPRPPAAPSPQYFLIVGPKGQVTCSMLQNMVNCF